jgi:hypothetical protein
VFYLKQYLSQLDYSHHFHSRFFLISVLRR